jgi:hypothetical protein
MKKILFMAAAIVAATVVNAAAVSWKASNVIGPTGSTPSGTSVELICSIYTEGGVLVGSSSDNTVSFKAYTATIDGTANNTAYYADLSGSATVDGKEYVLADSIANTKFNFTTDAAATYSINFTDGTGMTSSGIGSWSASSWQAVAVPEPTSGLLLLLGMAGLALRRKQA